MNTPSDERQSGPVRPGDRQPDAPERDEWVPGLTEQRQGRIGVSRLVRWFDSVTSDSVKTLQFAFFGMVVAVILISIGLIAQAVAVSRMKAARNNSAPLQQTQPLPR
jgi:hypothetical protein